MQTVAESESEATSGPDGTLGTTLFFSKPNHRDNAHLIFNTIAYQLAIRHPVYYDSSPGSPRRIPSWRKGPWQKSSGGLSSNLLLSSKNYNGDKHLSILMDGLDECEGGREQCEIVMLISCFVADHPNLPLLWIVVSRPEPHLKHTFLRKAVEPIHWKEGVPIDSDDACKDVGLRPPSSLFWVGTLLCPAEGIQGQTSFPGPP